MPVRDLYLVQMMSQCRTRLPESLSLHVAIPNVAGGTSRATCRLSRLTEHIHRNTCVANNFAVAVTCRVSRVTERCFNCHAMQSRDAFCEGV